MRCALVCEVYCGEAVIKLLVEVSLDGGDLFLLCGFSGERQRQVVQGGRLACSSVVRVRFEVGQVGL